MSKEWRPKPHEKTVAPRMGPPQKGDPGYEAYEEQQRRARESEDSLIGVALKNPVGAVGWTAASIGCGLMISDPLAGGITLAAGAGLTLTQYIMNRRKEQ